MTIPASVYFFLLVELLFVSWIDLKRKRIANIWALLNIIFFIICLIILPEHYHLKLETFFYPVVFLIVGFFLFSLKIMGAGDSKYLFSLFLLIPNRFQDIVFYYILYATIIVGLMLLSYNTLTNFDKLKRAIMMRDVSLIRQVYGSKFSYAPVIGAAWLWFGWSFKLLINF